eukprot:CCRYP_017874-RB/>CCRYP_017874-RB protein AED:0.48 eAED:0.66 QI:0/0/0/1/0/0/3/0/77
MSRSSSPVTLPSWFNQTSVSHSSLSSSSSSWNSFWARSSMDALIIMLLEMTQFPGPMRIAIIVAENKDNESFATILI